jgi:hypothetical protein
MSTTTEELRAAAVEFLDRHAPRRTAHQGGEWGVGDDTIGLLDGYSDRAAEAEALERAPTRRR